LAFGDFTYMELASGTVRHTYRFLPEVRRRVAVHATEVTMRTEPIGGQEMARIVVTRDQKFGFNSPPFTVTPGANFKLTVPIASYTDQGVFGSAFILWLGDDGRSVPKGGRARVSLGADHQPVAS